MVRETILVVDDEPSIVQFICDRLEWDGFTAIGAGSGEAALAIIDAESPDLVVLDLMLPGMDGFQVLRRLRQRGDDTPVIVLTARDDDVDLILSLELGADDYMAKPFNPRELSARARAVLRRRAEALLLAERVAALEAQIGSDSSQTAVVLQAHGSGLHFDQASHRAWYEGKELDLRTREYDLLCFLAQHRGQVLSRSTLLDRVWGLSVYIDERTVDVHVHRLRRKLAKINPEADPIRTERGIGYCLDL